MQPVPDAGSAALSAKGSYARLPTSLRAVAGKRPQVVTIAVPSPRPSTLAAAATTPRAGKTQGGRDVASMQVKEERPSKKAAPVHGPFRVFKELFARSHQSAFLPSGRRRPVARVKKTHAPQSAPLYANSTIGAEGPPRLRCARHVFIPYHIFYDTRRQLLQVLGVEVQDEYLFLNPQMGEGEVRAKWAELQTRTKADGEAEAQPPPPPPLPAAQPQPPPVVEQPPPPAAYAAYDPVTHHYAAAQQPAMYPPGYAAYDPAQAATAAYYPPVGAAYAAPPQQPRWGYYPAQMQPAGYGPADGGMGYYHMGHAGAAPPSQGTAVEGPPGLPGYVGTAGAYVAGYGPQVGYADPGYGVVASAPPMMYYGHPMHQAGMYVR